jgi:hypothetical protein
MYGTSDNEFYMKNFMTFEIAQATCNLTALQSSTTSDD